MKKAFIVLFASAVSISSFAQNTCDQNNAGRKITTGQSITSLVINDNISVVLLNGISKEITIEGNGDMIEKFVVTQSNGTVTISNYSGKKRTAALVYVPASLLSKISINGSSAVSSYEMLYNKNIDVLVNGDCKLWLKTFGNINVDATGGYDYTYSARKIKE